MFTISSEKITACRRCGTCCKKGGPVLHRKDIDILLGGHIGYRRLVTLRKGEQAYNPVRDTLEPIPLELIKIAGNGVDWGCSFYDGATAACAVYRHRPLECRLLKCWETSGIIAVIGRNTLRRSDIINPGDPVLELIDRHEQECPCDEIESLILAFAERQKKAAALARMKELVHNDLSIRTFAFNELELNREFEMFIFGRPLAQILAERGLKVTMREEEKS